jgi:hypothetical protein
VAWRGVAWREQYDDYYRWDKGDWEMSAHGVRRQIRWFPVPRRTGNLHKLLIFMS